MQGSACVGQRGGGGGWGEAPALTGVRVCRPRPGPELPTSPEPVPVPAAPAPGPCAHATAVTGSWCLKARLSPADAGERRAHTAHVGRDRRRAARKSHKKQNKKQRPGRTPAGEFTAFGPWRCSVSILAFQKLLRWTERACCVNIQLLDTGHTRASKR